MQRKAIAALMISLLLLSACGHGAGEQTFEAFRDTLTGKLVTVTAQVRVQRGDTVTDYTLTCQELPDAMTSRSRRRSRRPVSRPICATGRARSPLMTLSSRRATSTARA